MKYSIFILAAAFALAGCQTIKQSALPGRDDVRLVEYVESDGTVAKSFYQMRTVNGWFEAERKNGIWGLSDMGKEDLKNSLNPNASGSGGGGGGCGG